MYKPEHLIRPKYAIKTLYHFAKAVFCEVI